MDERTKLLSGDSDQVRYDGLENGHAGETGSEAPKVQVEGIRFEITRNQIAIPTSEAGKVSTGVF